ncbi:MAG: SufE family protein [Micavibrio sp.]
MFKLAAGCSSCKGLSDKMTLSIPLRYTYIKAPGTLKFCEFHKMTITPLAELTENFSLFDDWEGRYQYLIELGDSVPPMEDALKTDATEVKGCVSKVWLHYTRDDAGRFHFHADSDGRITKGLVYIVLAAYEGKTARDIAAVNIEEAFAQIGLSENLSPNRRNGFFAMVERIKGLAAG